MQSTAEDDGYAHRPRRRASLGAASLFGVAAAFVLTGCTALARPPRQPVLAGVEIGTVELHSIALADADASRWQGFGDLLAQQAEVALHRFALEEQIAASLQAPPGAPRLSGTLEIPTALPAGTIGSWAAFREGNLAVARLELTAPDGRPMATATARLEWDDVRWTMGGHQQRRARRPEAALADAVDRVLQLALRELTRELESQNKAVAASERRQRSRSWQRPPA